MNIVLEGPDGGGKSTLAQRLAESFDDFRIQPSEGRDKYPGEQNERVERYLMMQNVLFDRHPAISQDIYCMIRGGHETCDPQLVARFYTTDPVIVYCRVTDAATALGHHVIKDHDTPEHLRQVEENYDTLIRHYDEWALEHAHIIYRIGDSPKPVLAFIRRRIYEARVA